MSQRCSRATEKPQRKGENLFRYHVVWDFITWQVEWMHEWWELNPSYQTEMQSRNNVLATDAVPLCYLRARLKYSLKWWQAWALFGKSSRLFFSYIVILSSEKGELKYTNSCKLQEFIMYITVLEALVRPPDYHVLVPMVLLGSYYYILSSH